VTKKELVIKLGKVLEESGFPREHICARLKHDLKGRLSRSTIQMTCPPQWKDPIFRQANRDGKNQYSGEGKYKRLIQQVMMSK
jgi:hypothetical protein